MQLRLPVSKLSGTEEKIYSEIFLVKDLSCWLVTSLHLGFRQHTQSLKENFAILTLSSFVDGDGLDVDVRTVSDINCYPIEVKNKLQENQDCNAGTTIFCLKYQTARRYLVRLVLVICSNSSESKVYIC